MTNGSAPRLEAKDDVLKWAIYHQAVFDGKCHEQDGCNARQDAWNGKQEAWMLSLERRIRANENRGAKMMAVGTTLGGIIAMLVSLAVSLIK